MFIFTGFRLHMLRFCSIFINFGLVARMKRKLCFGFLFCSFFLTKKKSKHVFKKWHFECFIFGIMRSQSFAVYSRQGETDANLDTHTCTLAGLGVTCHNILETAPPVSRLVIPAQSVPFNSWCIIHSVTHLHTPRQTHTHLR